MCSRARLDEYIFRSILIFVVGIFHAFPYVFGIDVIMVIFHFFSVLGLDVVMVILHVFHVCCAWSKCRHVNFNLSPCGLV